MLKYSLKITKLLIIYLFLSVVANSMTLKIETHYSANNPSGQAAAQFAKNVEKFSGGEIKIEMFYRSSISGNPSQVWNSARKGLIDCDFTSGKYQISKNAGFQFVSNIIGGYDTPYQQYELLDFPGARETISKLYNKYEMEFIGWWIPGQNSLISTKPLRDILSLKNFKLRSSKGMESEIFKELGSEIKSIGFGDVPFALQTGKINGVDYSYLGNNTAAGFYEESLHTSYPGFHSMPTDHLACNKKVWDDLTAAQKGALFAAIEICGRTITSVVDRRNKKVLKKLYEKGVITYDFSKKDRLAFRSAAVKIWNKWKKKSPEAKQLVELHIKYIQEIGLL